MTESEYNQAVKDGKVEQIPPTPIEQKQSDVFEDDFSAEQNQLRQHSTALFMPTALRVYRTTSVQTIPNSDRTKIQYNAKSYDDLGEFDLTSLKFEPRYPGKYLITAGIELNSLTATKTMYGFIYKNGSEYLRATYTSPLTGDSFLALNDILELKPGDYIELLVNQNTGSDMFLGFDNVNWLAIHRLS
jgi:hypothetical protein